MMLMMMMMMLKMMVMIVMVVVVVMMVMTFIDLSVLHSLGEKSHLGQNAAKER